MRCQSQDVEEGEKKRADPLFMNSIIENRAETENR